LVDDHVSLDALPLATVLGLALKATVTVGCALTETVADCAAVPTDPVHVNVKVALAFSAPVDCEPCTTFAPDQAPEAAHAVALVADQFNVALLPVAMALGPTLRLTVGVGDLMETAVDWDALPPGPEQVRL
jgi:hypothetical protein